MKKYILSILVFTFLLTSVSAQFRIRHDTVDDARYTAVLQAKQFLVSGLNLVFYLPCDDFKGWDTQLIGSKNVVFGADRYKMSNRALIFTMGHKGLQVNPGAYFKDDFTISVWVNVENISKWSRIIDFGNGQNNSNVVFSGCASMSGIPGLAIYRGEGTDLTQVRGTEKDRLKEGEWYHLAATLQGNTARLYLNGMEIAKAENFYKPGNINRLLCLIGKSNFEGESNFYGSLDDLRIYDKGLNEIEIKLLADWQFYKLKSIGTENICNFDPARDQKPTSGETKSVSPDPNPVAKTNSSADPSNGSAAGTSVGGKNPIQANPVKKPVVPKSTDTIRKGIVILDTLFIPDPGFPHQPQIDTTMGYNKVVPVACLKAKYKSLDLSALMKEKDWVVKVNELLSAEGLAGWQLKGDITGLWLYKWENSDRKWEHRIVKLDEKSEGSVSLNTMGSQGWEVTIYFGKGVILSRPLAEAERVKWEYSSVVTPSYAKNQSDLATNREQASEILNKMGKDGWELYFILKTSHFFKRITGSQNAWLYTISHNSNPAGFAASSTALGLLGWQFGASPMVVTSVNFACPVVYKKPVASDIDQRVFCSKYIERIGLLGGGNSKVYEEIDESVNQYTENGWVYEGPFDIVDSKFGLLFSAYRNCFANATNFTLGVYDTPQKGNAYYLARLFYDFSDKLPGIVHVSRFCRVVKLIELEQELSKSGLTKAGNEVKSNFMEDVSVYFTDKDENAVKASVQGKKGEKSFEFQFDKLTWGQTVVKFQEMVDYAKTVK